MIYKLIKYPSLLYPPPCLLSGGAFKATDQAAWSTVGCRVRSGSSMVFPSGGAEGGLTGRGLARPRLPGIVFARFNAASFAKWLIIANLSSLLWMLGRVLCCG